MCLPSARGVRQRETFPGQGALVLSRALLKKRLGVKGRVGDSPPRGKVPTVLGCPGRTADTCRHAENAPLVELVALHAQRTEPPAACTDTCVALRRDGGLKPTRSSGAGQEGHRRAEGVHGCGACGCAAQTVMATGTKVTVAHVAARRVTTPACVMIACVYCNVSAKPHIGRRRMSVSRRLKCIAAPLPSPFSHSLTHSRGAARHAVQVGAHVLGRRGAAAGQRENRLDRAVATAA